MFLVVANSAMLDTTTYAGTSPDLKRLLPLVDFPFPHNIHALRSVLSALWYYCQFIRKFSQEVSCSFHILPCKRCSLSSFNEETLRDFSAFFQSDFILHSFHGMVSVAITVASATNIGAVLGQSGQSVTYTSKKHTEASKKALNFC